VDPDATWDRWRRAVRDQDWEEARNAHWDLQNWLNRGGFEPRWTERQQLAFYDWESPYNDENPAKSENDSFLFLGIGVVLVGIVGYAIYRATTQAAQVQVQQIAAQPQVSTPPAGSVPPMPVNITSTSESPYTTDQGT
jgi:hypothetical protein